MTITFFDVASTPADNGAQAGPGPVVITPPADMLAGDLAPVFNQYRGSDIAIRMYDSTNAPTEHGGQSWNWPRWARNTNVSGRMFWSRFNGTWPANPSWRIDSGTEAFTAVMPVFRPSSSGKVWVPNGWPITGTFAAPVGPNFTVTIPGITTTDQFGSASHVIVICVMTPDANTWGNPGNGWTLVSPGQFRNLNGAAPDQSMAILYKIQTASGATQDATIDQLMLGGDAGVFTIAAFTEVDALSGGPVEAVARVQFKGFNNAESADTIAQTFDAPVSSGKTVIVAIGHETAADGGVTDVSDDQGNKYMFLGTVNRAFLAVTASFYWRPNITNGPVTVTATLSQTEITRTMYLVEVAGIGSFDKYVGSDWAAQDSLNPELMDTDSLTPDVDGCYLFGFAANADFPEDDTAFYTPQTGWTEITELLRGINLAPISCIDERILATAAATPYEVTARLGRDHILVYGVFRPAVAAAAAETLMGQAVL